MRRLTLSAVLAVACCAIFAQSAVAAQTDTLSRPSPLSDELRAQIHAAGPEGVQVSEEFLNTECPGAQEPPGVSANGCIVDPAGCTANFIFSDGSDWRVEPYVGTASHCVDKVGQPVIMQVDTTTLAEVGTVYKQTADEEPGDDFALIRVYPEVAAKWGVNPAAPTGGPQGIYDGCAPQAVKYYGHGYGVAVGQGKPEGGLADKWYSDGFGWFGVGFPGDSGSGVTIQDNRSAGNFTHIIIFDPDLFYAPGQLAGMRTTAILDFLGSSFSQVNADGSLSRDTTTACASTGAYGGSGGGSKPKGGGKPSGKGKSPKGSTA